MRVCIYSRVSTDKQDAANQLAQLREFAAKQNWTVVAEYVDLGEPGAKSDRAEFQRMLEDSSRRKFDLVLFWSLDRLTREGALKTLQYLNQFTTWGVGFRSYTESYLDSCGMFRDAVVAILGCIAAQEKARISERTRAGLARVRAAGKTLGRPAKLNGYHAAEIARLKALGHSGRAVAARLGIAESSVRRLAAR